LSSKAVSNQPEIRRRRKNPGSQRLIADGYLREPVVSHAFKADTAPRSSPPLTFSPTPKVRADFGFKIPNRTIRETAGAYRFRSGRSWNRRGGEELGRGGRRFAGRRSIRVLRIPASSPRESREEGEKV